MSTNCSPRPPVQTDLQREREIDIREKERILRERARDLAAAHEKSAEQEDARQVVLFSLDRETYGFELRYVREVCPLQDFVPLPGTPDFVLGIINVRGQILSIVNLKKFFDLPEKALTDLNRVIILKRGEMEFGILADSIAEVRSISFATLQPSVPTLTDQQAAYLKGVTAERNIILDAKAILEDPKMIVREKVRK